jgi:predicted methyltransferase
MNIRPQTIEARGLTLVIGEHSLRVVAGGATHVITVSPSGDVLRIARLTPADEALTPRAPSPTG